MQKIKIVIIFLSLTLMLACSGKQSVRQEDTFDAEKTFAKANELMAAKEYEEARNLFLEIKSRDLTQKYAPLAQLRVADSYIKEDEEEKSINEYKRFIEIYPEHKYASYAQYQIGMIYFNQIESSERGYGAASRALIEFEKLKQMYPRNPFKEVLEIRIERCKFIMADYELVVGTFYYKKDSYDAAIKRLEGLLQKYPDFKKEADALYYLALSYKKRGDKNKAGEYLNKLIEKYPDNPLIPEAKKELTSVKK